MSGDLCTLYTLYFNWYLLECFTNLLTNFIPILLITFFIYALRYDIMILQNHNKVKNLKQILTIKYKKYYLFKILLGQ